MAPRSRPDVCPACDFRNDTPNSLPTDTPQMPEQLMRLDLWIIFGYLLAMIVVGWLVTDGSRDVEGFTVGNREMKGWVVGLSVLGTFLSSITFLGVPARVYHSGNWNTYVFGLGLPVAALVAVYYFIPLYRHRVQLSAYEYLEQRFGLWARTYAAASFVLLNLIRVAMVLLLVALAVQPLLNWDVVPTLLGLGLVVVIYDVMGGIKAVIWTDVAQVAVLLGGALWCLWELMDNHPGGAGQFWHDIPPGSFSLGDLASWDTTRATFLVMFVYAISENLRNYGTDQNYVQRMLCAANDREAATSIWIGALSYLPISMIFCLIGTGLFMHYHPKSPLVEPGENQVRLAGVVPLDTNAQSDSVFPHFIRHELSPAARGMVVAGILAAAMSTVDSCLNSISMVVLVDMVRRFRRRKPWLPEIITLRLFTATSGMLGAAGAALVYLMNRQQVGKLATLMDLWWEYAGVAGAGLFGLFLLAWLAPRLPGWGALVAVLSSVPVLVWGMVFRTRPVATPGWRWDNCPLHPNLLGLSGMAVLLASGALIALFASKPRSAGGTEVQP